MKPKKLMFIPVLLVALASCSGGSKISKEDANLRVSAAIEHTLKETYKSIDLSLDLAAVLTHKRFDDKNKLVDHEKIEISGAATAKGKDLDKPTGEFAITASGTFNTYRNDKKIMGVNGDVAFYYVDAFGYTNTSLTQYDGYSGETLTQAVKQKMEVGPFPGIPDFDDVLDDFIAIGSNEEGMLNSFLPKIGNVAAKEEKGELVVKYEIVQEDLVLIAMEALYNVNIGDLSAEDLATAKNVIREELAALILLRKFVISVTVSANNYISGFSANLDFDVFDDAYFTDKVTGNVTHGKAVTTVKGSANLKLQINKPVTIAFPDFSDYVLIEE